MENNILDNKILWQKKWEAIVASFEKFAQLSEGTPTESSDPSRSDAEPNRRQIVRDRVADHNNTKLPVQHQLIDRLRDFSIVIFGLLYEGFYAASDVERKEKIMDLWQDSDPMVVALSELSRPFKNNLDIFFTSEYPIDYLINTLLRQISLDLVRLEQAMHLRSNATELFHDQQLTHALAEFLAERAVEPCGYYNVDFHSGQNDIKKSTVITHPANSVEVRLLPYSEAVLIGFPITAYTDFDVDESTQAVTSISLSTDFLALSHESGHLLYRNGRTGAANTMPIRTALNRALSVRLAELRRNPQQSRWLFRWLEELFADTYGCFLDGPVCVVGFQELLATGKPTDLHESDGKHPIPVLRPLIQTQILRALAARRAVFHWPKEHVDQIADALDQRWQNWVLTNWSGWVNNKWPYGFFTAADVSAGICQEVTDILRGADYEVGGVVKNGQDILDDVGIVIELILDVLEPNGSLAYRNWDRVDWEGLLALDGADGATEPENIAKTLFDDYCKTAFNAFNQINAQSAASQIDLSTPAWLLSGLENMKGPHNQANLFDQIIDLILFSGWSNEGPEVDHTGG